MSHIDRCAELGYLSVSLVPGKNLIHYLTRATVPSKYSDLTTCTSSHPHILIKAFSVWTPVQAIHRAPSKDQSDGTNMQAYQSPRWAHAVCCFYCKMEKQYYYRYQKRDPQKRLKLIIIRTVLQTVILVNVYNDTS